MAPQQSYTHSFTKIYRKTAYPAISPQRPELSMAGKIIVVTGGGTGIGFAIAESFLDAGAASVVLFGRREDVLKDAVAQLQKKGMAGAVRFFVASVTDREVVAKAFSEIRKTIGEPDILVSNAAYFWAQSEAFGIELDYLTRSFETNVNGNWDVVQNFLGLGATGASTKKGGEVVEELPAKIILDVSSSAAHTFIPRTGAYTASKTAFTKLLTTAMMERAAGSHPRGRKIRAHSFHPGNILTQPARDAGYDEKTLPWDDALLPGHFSVWLASPEAEFLDGRFVWSNMDVVELIARENEIVERDLLKLGLLGEAPWQISNGSAHGA